MFLVDHCDLLKYHDDYLNNICTVINSNLGNIKQYKQHKQPKQYNLQLFLRPCLRARSGRRPRVLGLLPWQSGNGCRATVECAVEWLWHEEGETGNNQLLQRQTLSAQNFFFERKVQLRLPNIFFGRKAKRYLPNFFLWKAVLTRSFITKQTILLLIQTGVCHTFLHSYAAN